MSIKKRAAGLFAAAGLVTGLFAVGAPSAHAIQLMECHGFSFFGTIVPPLQGNGAVTTTVAQMKTAKAGTVIWYPAFGQGVDPTNGFSITTDGTLGLPSPGSCTIHTTPGNPAGDITDNTMTVGAKLAGKASCDSASVDPSQYPLNGKLSIGNIAKTFKEQYYMRVAGFDGSAGPDVISITGIDVKGNMPGASLSGEVGFDPVVKNAVTFTVPTIGADLTPGTGDDGLVTVLKNQYYFDNQQAPPNPPCGQTGGHDIGLIYGTDETSLLGSSGQPLSIDI